MPSVFGDQVGAMMDTFTMETPVHQVGTTVQKGWLMIVTCTARLRLGCWEKTAIAWQSQL